MIEGCTESEEVKKAEERSKATPLAVSCDLKVYLIKTQGSAGPLCCCECHNGVIREESKYSCTISGRINSMHTGSG